MTDIGMDISSLLEVQVNEEPLSDSVEGNFLGSENDEGGVRTSEEVSAEENHFRKLMFGQDIAQVRFRRLHCTSCDTHIGSAPAEAYNMQEHPVLKTLLCAACREFYGDGTFEQGEDATDMFCRWCANGGNLYCCSNCSNTFCQKCIRINFDAEVRKNIEADEKWKCFVCYPAPLYSHRSVCHALQQHIKTLSRILTADRVMTPKEILSKMEQDDSQCCPGRKAKRKRRVSISSSDEDSEPVKTRPKKRAAKRRRVASRDSNEQPNGRYHQAPKIEDDDITSLLNPVQTMVEGDVDSVIIPSSPNKPIARVLDGQVATRMPILQPISSQNILRPAITRGRVMIPVRPLRKIDSLPPGATPHMITRLPNYRQSAPMVTIPTRPIIITTPGVPGGPARIIPGVPIRAAPGIAPRGTPGVPPRGTISVRGGPAMRGGLTRVRNYSTIHIERSDPKSQESKQIPSVIELESDSDNDSGKARNSTVPNQASGAKPNDNHSGLSEPSSGATGNPPQPLSGPSDVTYPRLTVRRFDQNIDNPVKAVDEIVKSLRKRVRVDMRGFGRTSDGESQISSARRKLKIINRNISKIVEELASFNNSMIRQYTPWKESTITGNPIEDSSGKIILRKGEPSHKFIPLEMECERESGSDLDNDEEDATECSENLINFSNRLVNFIDKDTVERGCSAHVNTTEKSVQVDDNITTDYDKTIGYSLLTRTDTNREKTIEILKPVNQEDFSGKYEEQFIFYLQRLEDVDDDRDDEKENAGPEKSLNEMIEADLSIGKRQIDQITKAKDAKISELEQAEDELMEIISDTNDMGDKTIEENEKLSEIDGLIEEQSMDISESVKDIEDAQDAGDGEADEMETNEIEEVNGTTVLPDEENEVSDVINQKGDEMNEMRDEINDTGDDDETRDDTNEITDGITDLAGEANGPTDATPDADIHDGSTENNQQLENIDEVSVNEKDKHEETVIAVRALIEDENSEETFTEKWKGGEDDDECSVLE